MTTTVGPDGTQYTAVVDISRHQGNVGFTTMRARGVSDLIIRVTNGVTVDSRAGGYIAAARDAGYTDDHLAYYTFINPKAATPEACARKTVDTIGALTGRTDVGLMDDIESYVTEGGSLPYVQGPRFADWIRTFNATVAHEVPDCYLFGYTNRAYWDGNAKPVTGIDGPWVGDAALAAEMEWIVPRYPVYPPPSVINDPHKLAAWVLTSSKPPAPKDWAEWAYSKATGPFPPAGGKTSGWQFSAGWNRQGPVYGCQSSDLDLNIVRAEVWARWTQPDPVEPPPPPPPPTDEEIDTVKIKAPGQWFEKCGMDLRAITNATAEGGVEFGALPGAEVVLSNEHMLAMLDTIRHTYGTPKADMGSAFLAAWNAKKPNPTSTGGGAVVFPTYTVGAHEIVPR